MPPTRGESLGSALKRSDWGPSSVTAEGQDGADLDLHRSAVAGGADAKFLLVWLPWTPDRCVPRPRKAGWTKVLANVGGGAMSAEAVHYNMHDAKTHLSPSSSG